MRNKIFIVLITIFTIINIVAATFIFLDISIMESPVTTITVDIIEISSDEVILQTTINVANPNSFEVSTKNFNVVTTTTDGYEVARISLEGGDISPYDNRTFSTAASIAFDGYTPETLTTTVKGVIGITIGFIKKTLPLNIKIITKIEEVLKQFSPPSLHIQVDFEEITQKEINLTGIITVDNPNTFDIYIDDISGMIVTETGKNVGYLKIFGDVIAAKSSQDFDGIGRIIIDAINAEVLMVNINGSAGAKIAGINESLSFNVQAQIPVPDLGTILSDEAIDAVIRGDYKVSIRGLIDEIIFEVNNPHKIDLYAENITIFIHRVDNNEDRLITQGSLGSGLIKGENVTIFEGQCLIPYSKLFPVEGQRFFPDWLKITIRAEISILGINQSIKVGVVGYQDLHLFS